MMKMPEGDKFNENSSFVAKSVLLRGGTPWGFRIQGGRDTGYPLRISRINPNSKAAIEGVKEGDVIEAINGRPANQLNHREAHQIIRDALHYLRLSLKRNISCSTNNRKPVPPIAMFRTSTCIEVNSPTGDPSEQLPHSTTLIFKSAGRGQMTRKSSGEAVIEGEMPLERCSSLDSQSTVASDTCNSTSSLNKKEDVSVAAKATPTSNASNGDVTSCVPSLGKGDQTANGSAHHSPQYKSGGKSTFEMPVVAVPNFKANQIAEPVVWSPYKSTAVQESSESPKSPPKQSEPKTPERPEAPSENVQLAWKPFGISGGNNLDPHLRNDETLTSHDPVPSEEFGGKSPRQPPSIPPKAPSSSSRTTVSSLSSSSVPSSPPAPALPPLPSFNRIRLPPSQSPTITLLQKAREGHIPKGTVYIDHKMTDRDESGSGREMPITRTGTGPHDTIYAIKYEESQPSGRRIVHKAPTQYVGIGPTEQGVPVGLRTGVKEENKGEWYKRMYKSLHRTEHDDDYLVVKYRRQGRIPYSSHSGYMSEPEPDRRDDYDHWRSATLDRRKGNESPQSATSRTLPNKERQKPVYPQWTPPSARYRADIYRNQPKRIEDYEPGRSSIAEMIAKSDEDISQVGNMSADYWMTPPHPLAASSLAQTTKNTSYRPAYPYLYKDGYESDSTLVCRKQMDTNGHSQVTQMTPIEQRERYKDIQRGGEIPLTGFRRPAPEKPKDGSGQLNVATNASTKSASSARAATTSTSLASARTAATSNATNTTTSASGACDDFSDFDIDFNLDFNNLVAPPPKVPLIDKDSARRYQESEVNIHYRSPIRASEKEYMSEEELRRRQEETMRQIYDVERKKKALQELSDLESRRHSDNIPPSQKSPIPLNRYDNTYDISTSPVPRARTPEPKTVARALFNFTAQNTNSPFAPRELSFSKGDIIFIHRQVDKNWYEGEHHGLFGWFPVNYVEIIPYDNVRPVQTKRQNEGQARAKFTFRAQSPMELSFVKGESVIITRRVDNNWFEGRVGSRRGIFPVCYVDVLVHPSETNGSVSPPAKPVASPVSHSLIMNGSNYSPIANNYQLPSKHGPKMQTYISAPIPYSTVRKIPPRSVETYYEDRRLPVDQSLHVDTHSDNIPYRALYNYQPQNDDELELVEGDIVYVMEKCDDGWFVGTSSKTGLFGTFPGNYVERIKF